MPQLKQKPTPGGAAAGGAFSALRRWKGSRLLIPPVVRIRPHSAPSSPSLGMTLGKVASVEHLSQELTILLVAGGECLSFPQHCSICLPPPQTLALPLLYLPSTSPLGCHVGCLFHSDG